MLVFATGAQLWQNPMMLVYSTGTWMMIAPGVMLNLTPWSIYRKGFLAETYDTWFYMIIFIFFLDRYLVHLSNKKIQVQQKNPLGWDQQTNPGPLVLLEKFDISTIKWCTMHCLNLGLLMSLCGGILILGITSPNLRSRHCCWRWSHQRSCGHCTGW